MGHLLYVSSLMCTTIPQFCINGTLVDQLIVSPTLNYLSLLDDIDLVSTGNGGQPVCYRDRRPTHLSLVQRLLHHLLTLHVQGRGGLVQQEDLGVPDQDPDGMTVFT